MPLNPSPRGDFGGTGGTKKDVIVGAVQRKGNLVARVIDRLGYNTISRFVNEAISDKVSLISTDEASVYRKLPYPHGVVYHSRDEYVAGAVHTNTIEGFWSLVKRGIMGTFHKVSKKYLPLYVNEFEFRYNNRMNPDIFGAAIRVC